MGLSHWVSFAWRVKAGSEHLVTMPSFQDEETEAPKKPEGLLVPAKGIRGLSSHLPSQPEPQLVILEAASPSFSSHPPQWD